MALTSSTDLPSPDTGHATPDTLTRFLVAWTVWAGTVAVLSVRHAAAMTWWALTEFRVELNGVHLIPAVMGILALLLAVIALGFYA